MVFMGSNKYPEENAFDEFLKVCSIYAIYKTFEFTRYAFIFYFKRYLKIIEYFRRMEEVPTLQLITKLPLLNLRSISVFSTKLWQYLPNSLPLLCFCQRA